VIKRVGSDAGFDRGWRLAMGEEDLCWRVEQACTNAWPARRQVFMDGWLLKAAGGPSRRINSLNPLRAASFDPAPVIEACGPICARLGQPLVVRAPDIAAGLSGRLAALGFRPEGETCTLSADLRGIDVLDDGSVDVAVRPGADWLALRSSLNGDDREADRVLRETIEAIGLPTAFACLRQDGVAASLAFGVLDRGLLVVESVATLAGMRQRGFARRTVSALMRWARHQGATNACLQVVAANAPARALYGSLGFETELYRYAYWRKPAGS
jgi:GNAT superfamily N-acetyltransferase